jgi:ADP-ribosylglycohydrolase
MLLEIAIGDAYGAGFEFCPRAKIARANDGLHYEAHEKGIPPGRYTDDTQMSIAVAELLLRDDLPEPDGHAFAEAFLATYRRDPRPGYASHFAALLEECTSGAELRRRLAPGSRRNGAAMRSVPLALVRDPARLERIAHAQASVTHDSPEGRLSSFVVGTMGHALLHGRARVASLPHIVAARTGFHLRSDWSAEVACDAIETLHAVNTALQRHRGMAALLRECVEFGGDVDSVAAIALGLAALADDYAADIPAPLHDALEDGPFGRTWLRALDERLAAAEPRLRRMGPGLQTCTPTVAGARKASGLHAGCRSGGESLRDSAAASAPPRGPAGSAPAEPDASLP